LNELKIKTDRPEVKAWMNMITQSNFPKKKADNTSSKKLIESSPTIKKPLNMKST
jgi:hypothetical protein